MFYEDLRRLQYQTIVQNCPSASKGYSSWIATPSSACSINTAFTDSKLATDFISLITN